MRARKVTCVYWESPTLYSRKGKEDTYVIFLFVCSQLMKSRFFFSIGAQYPVGRWFCRIRLLFLSSDAGLYKLVVFLLVDLWNVIPRKRSLIISNLALRNCGIRFVIRTLHGHDLGREQYICVSRVCCWFSSLICLESFILFSPLNSKSYRLTCELCQRLFSTTLVRNVFWRCDKFCS